MSTIPSDAYRASAAPHDAATTLRILDITDAADAEIALVSGLYELRLVSGSIGAFICAGASTASVAALTSGAAEAPGFFLGPGDVVTLWHDATLGDGKLHAILTDTGSSTVAITRKGGA